jgi:RHS repeat-associated protein
VEGLENADGKFGTEDKDTYLYDPYGEDVKVAPADSDPTDADAALSRTARENPFRFEGFYFDSGVKSYDMQAREYRPDSGRFLSQDRYESAAADQMLQADPLTQNRYAFAGGNPVNNVEFDGHDTHANDSACQANGGSTSGCHHHAAVVGNQQAEAANGTNHRASGGGAMASSPTPTSSARESGPATARSQQLAAAHAGRRACFAGSCQSQPVPAAMRRGQARSPLAAKGVAEQQGAQEQATLYTPTLDSECNSVTCANPIRTPEREAEVRFNQKMLRLMLIGDPAHNIFDAITLFPTPFKGLRVFRAADDLAGGLRPAAGTSKLFSGARYPLSPKVQGQLGKRGWTTDAIDEAVQSGKQVRAVNKATGNPATRYIHPNTGQSVVIDDVTGQVIHVGGPGFKYGPGGGDVP